MTDIILVDLDALLDTRLSVYRQCGMDLDLIVGKGYKGRIYDRFEGIDSEVFYKAYMARDNTSLIDAVVTDIPRVLKRRLLIKASDTMRAPDIEICINLHPYQIDKKASDLIVDHVSSLLMIEGLPIRTITVPPSELSFGWMEEHSISDYYTYGYEWWLNERIDEIKAGFKCLSLMLHTPALVTKEIKNFPKWYLENDKVFESLSVEIGVVVSLLLEPASWYSATLLEKDTPEYLKEPTIEIEDLTF